MVVSLINLQHYGELKKPNKRKKNPIQNTPHDPNTPHKIHKAVKQNTQGPWEKKCIILWAFIKAFQLPLGQLSVTLWFLLIVPIKVKTKCFPISLTQRQNQIMSLLKNCLFWVAVRLLFSASSDLTPYGRKVFVSISESESLISGGFILVNPKLPESLPYNILA